MTTADLLPPTPPGMCPAAGLWTFLTARAAHDAGAAHDTRAPWPTVSTCASCGGFHVVQRT